MVRESDVNVRQHFKQTNHIFECIYCGKEFKGKPSVTRLRHHLLGESNKGIRPCEKVPEHVKTDVHSNKRRRMLESGPVNDEMPNPASASLPPQNDHLVQEQSLMLESGSVNPASTSLPPQNNHLESSNLEPMPEQLRTFQNRSIPLLASELVGKSYKGILEEILSSLKNENVSKIGIYGMGGAGKTELARHIYNKLLEQSDYDFACWITVSPHFSIRKLQYIIANAINFELLNKDVEIIRAELSRRLVDKKFVIILDDLWSYISLDDVGMTDGSMNGCKLIMTTRSLDICRTMNCQKNVLVNCHEYVRADEGWNIFKKELGKEEILSGVIETAARDIVRECRGLPLMIKCMGRSMRGVEDIQEWRNALEEMRSGKMNEEVFEQLKRSYEHLKDQSLRHCFLYCALFDGIRRKELIEHLIVEGIIEGRGNRRAKFDRAHALLNKLQNVCLLSSNRYSVGMHRLIRKMALQIMKEELPSKLEFSEEIKYLCMKGKMKISLNVEKKTLNLSDYVAACPNVSTMLILDHHSLTSIEDSFSGRFQNLKVLNLSRSSIVKLPKSVGGLKYIKALFLGRCKKLEGIPSLANLESLEVLDLCDCPVKEVRGLERLFNLRVLNLIGSDIEEIEAGILKRLTSLEFLAFGKPSKLGKEIVCLSKLESLIWWFSDIDEFDGFLSNARSPSLNAYMIYMGQFDMNYYWIDTEEPSGRNVCFREREIERGHLFCLSSYPTLLDRVEEVELEGLSNLQHLFGRETEYEASPNTTPPPQTCIFSNLKTFHVSNCDSIENLFPLHLLPNLQHLQELSVTSCSAMVEIIAAPEQDLTYADSHPNSTQTLQFSLPKLKTLSLEYLPKLTSICPTLLDRVEEVELKGLSNLQHLFGRETEYEASPNTTPPPQTCIFSNLKTFHVSNCNSIENLFPLHLLPNLQHLQKLSVTSCSKMVEIIAATEQDLTHADSHPNSIQTQQFSLPKLKTLSLKCLPKLTSICPTQINCESLCEIYMQGCENLEKIPISLPLPSLEILEVYPETWWESVSWDSSHQKDILQPCLEWESVSEYDLESDSESDSESETNFLL